MPDNDSKACPKISVIVFGILIFLLPGITRCARQEQFVPGPSKLITRFPIKMLTGGIIIIQALIGENTDSLNFVLDTGSGGISLDSTTVGQLKLTPTKSNRTIRGIAG